MYVNIPLSISKSCRHRADLLTWGSEDVQGQLAPVVCITKCQSHQGIVTLSHSPTQPQLAPEDAPASLRTVRPVLRRAPDTLIVSVKMFTWLVGFECGWLELSVSGWAQDFLLLGAQLQIPLGWAACPRGCGAEPPRGPGSIFLTPESGFRPGRGLPRAPRH